MCIIPGNASKVSHKFHEMQAKRVRSISPTVTWGC